jgi:feruloyl esterase
MRYTLTTVLIAAGALAAVAVNGELTATAAPSCESLASLRLPNTTITLAQEVSPGAFTPPAPAEAASATAGPAEAFRDLPAFCRVAATLKASSDSDIKIEVWMPTSGWNGKFQGVGNGGWAGSISYYYGPWPLSLASALRRGYAAASTDTGHVGEIGDGSFAVGHPEKLVDFAYRAVHEMTVQAKSIVSTYYGRAPRLSYWNSCSNGGRQGLKEAQQYPTDYDAIIAGAPGTSWTHLFAHSLWVAQAVLTDPKSFIPREKYAAIHRAVIQACDGLDGVKDGAIEDPTRCHFDPQVMQCTGADAATCLTTAQVEAARRIYAPARNPRTGREIFPGLEPGSEMGWAALAGPTPYRAANDHYRFVVFKNRNWDFKTLDFDKDLALADKRDHGMINATDPHLKRFFDRGGKLLMYHGWNDPLIAPRNSINYYTSVTNAFGGANKIADSMRLFMVPGMSHCSGGDGTGNFDDMKVLEQWVEEKKAPERIVVSHLTNGVADRTRPLCPFPQVAVYKGSGSADDAENFVCKTP